MTHYSIGGLARLWLSCGGQRADVVSAVAVSLAESGGNSNAISPANDYGLWQINEINFARYQLNAQTALDPVRNCFVAVAMSAGGDNWAPWCTAWADPGRHCGHGYLHTPQPGSSAYRFIDEVAMVLRDGLPPPTPPANPGNLHHVTNSWDTVRHYFRHGTQVQWGNLTTLSTAIRRIRS